MTIDRTVRADAVGQPAVADFSLSVCFCVSLLSVCPRFGFGPVASLVAGFRRAGASGAASNRSVRAAKPIAAQTKVRDEWTEPTVDGRWAVAMEGQRRRELIDQRRQTQQQQQIDKINIKNKQ